MNATPGRETVLQMLQSPLLTSQRRILALLDKIPTSPTYGSFDRKYWQYKILDFSSGMQQELVYPLGYLYGTKMEGNSLFGSSRIASFLEGVFRFQRLCSHPDGSLDDYFPHERAFGATAYALAALTETALFLGKVPGGEIDILEKNGRFLAGFREVGRLSNHSAIAAAALGNLAVLTGKDCWKTSSEHLVCELAKHQHAEGWFPEYEGCDLGYQTVTVEFLARLHLRFPDKKTSEMLTRLVPFIRSFLHPDGSLGGEYGSRNTFNFYPGGFALLSTQIPEAAEILGGYVMSLEQKTANCLDDDGVFGHLLSSHVTALRAPSFSVVKPVFQCQSQEPQIKIFSGCNLYVGQAGGFTVYGSLDKGGVFKVYRKDQLVTSDTGHVVRLKDGRLLCQNKPRSAVSSVKGSQIVIEGKLHSIKQPLLSQFRMIALRLFSILFGRFTTYSHLIRWVMQKMIIFHKSESQVSYMRCLTFSKSGIQVSDSLANRESSSFDMIWRTPDFVNMHVVTSNSFQQGNLLPWEEISFSTDDRSVKTERCFSNQT